MREPKAGSLVVSTLILLFSACTGDPSPERPIIGPMDSNGGADGTGGTNTGGAKQSTGGSNTAGNNTGGGGTGGSNTGGGNTGGANTGGANTGGNNTGGASSGGTGGMQGTTPVVTLWKGCNFSGEWTAMLPVGEYTQAQLASRGVLNNDASSIRVTGGYRAEMFDQDNFMGTPITVTGEVACLTSNSFNDMLSSIRVRAQ